MNRSLTVLARTAAALAVLVSLTSRADSRKLLQLIGMLRDNGTITQEQYDALMAAAEEPPAPAVETTPTVPAPPADLQVSTEGGLEVATYDGRYAFELNGRLYIDGAWYDEDREPLGSGTEVRQARLRVKSRIAGDWSLELGADFSDDIDLKDAYLRYHGFHPVTLTLGQVKEPFSLEEQTSSRFGTFMERALPNALVPERNIGFSAHTHADWWTATAGIFGEDFNDDPDDEGDEAWAATGRITVAPLHDDRRVLHLGAAASYREANDERELRIDTDPESHLTDRDYLDTDKLKDVEGQALLGLEAAGVMGPLSLQGEYIGARVRRDDNREDVCFGGWYASGSWFVTGESRKYDSDKGEFERIEPRSRRGALELALRFSRLDLTDESVEGGVEENLTLGVNWYLNPYTRMMFEYIHADISPNDGDVDANANVLQVRAQIDW